MTDPQPASARKQAKEAEDAARLAIYRTVSKKHYRELSGRQDKVLNEQAKRHGLPIGGSVIDLGGVLKRFHDLLAEHAKAKQKEPEPDSPALERFRDERAKMAKLDRLEREGSLIPRDLAHETFGEAAAVIRAAHEQLQRLFGREAGLILESAIEDAQAIVERKLNPPDDSSSTD